MSQIFAPNILKNETVIVTGGGSGIGERIAEELGSLGAKIAIGSRKPERIAAATERLRERGVDAVGATLDIRNEESIEAFLAFVASKMGPTSILINNAGGQFPSPAESISPKGWRAVIDTNLNGTWLMTSCRQRYAQAQTRQNHQYRRKHVAGRAWSIGSCQSWRRQHDKDALLRVGKIRS